MIKTSRCTALVALAFVSSTLSAQDVPSKATAGLSMRDVQLMHSAIVDMRAGRMEDAITAFKQVTQDAPGFAEAYLNLGLACANLSRNDEAGVALQKAISLRPGLRGANLFLAISQYKTGHFQLAASSIRKETVLSPSDAQAWMWQGIIDLALADLNTAVEDLGRAFALDPKNTDILYHRGRAALALSRSSYEEMFRQAPDSWHVHQVLAQADVETGHDVDAIEQYKLAIAAAPVQGGLYEALGSSLWRTGKYQQAEQAFETALKIDPSDTVTLYKLGCLRVDHGDAAGGKALLDKVIVADPSLKLALYYLGRATTELGNDTEAVADFKKVIAENVDADTTKQAYFQLSRVYRRLQDNPSAVAAQAEYRRLDEQGKDAMQEKLRQRRLRADRDISIPAPTSETHSETP